MNRDGCIVAGLPDGRRTRRMAHRWPRRASATRRTPPPRRMSTSTPPLGWDVVRRTDRAIVVADMAGSVALYERDEAGTVARWATLLRRLEGTILPGSGGRLVKSTGDGFILEFGDVSAAMRCASALHREFAAASAGAPPGMEMAARIGVNLADVYANEADIYGRGVNLAARLGSLAQPGGTIVSAAIRDRLVPGLDCEVEDIGPSYFKHATEPVPAFRVIGDGEPEPRLLGLGSEIVLQPAVAVIPFEGRLVDPAYGVVGEMLADSVIAKLSTGSALRVISRLSTSKLQGKALGARSACSVLGADFVLGGSYRMAGTEILLIAELSSAQDGEALWIREFRGHVRDLLSPDAEIVSRIRSEIGEAIAAREIRRARTMPLPALEAFELMLAGIAMMHRSSPAEFRRSRDLLETLVERYPQAPEPRAWLAKWYVLRVTRGLVAPEAAETERALEQTHRALDASPDCALALAIEGFVHIHLSRDLDVAEARLADAVSSNPSEPLAWLFMSVAHQFRGQGKSALEAAESALNLSPIDPMHHYFDALSSTAALAAGRFERAIQLADRALRTNRSHLPTLRCLAISQVELGLLEHASKTVQRILEQDQSFTIHRYLKDAPKGSGSNRAAYADALRRAGIPEI